MISKEDYDRCTCGHIRAEHREPPPADDGGCGHFSGGGGHGPLKPCGCKAFTPTPPIGTGEL